MVALSGTYKFVVLAVYIVYSCTEVKTHLKFRLDKGCGWSSEVSHGDFEVFQALGCSSRKEPYFTLFLLDYNVTF